VDTAGQYRLMEHTDGVQVVRAGTEGGPTAQTEGMVRPAGVDRTATSASKVWMGRVTAAPGSSSGPHHHGEAETAAYVLAGRMRIYYGEGFAEHVDLEAGDFVFVPPGVPHVEANEGDEPAELLACRSPDNIVVNLS